MGADVYKEETLKENSVRYTESERKTITVRTIYA